MSLSNTTRLELAELVDDLQEQMLTDVQLVRLNHLLSCDEECRREYILLTTMYSAIWSAGSNEKHSNSSAALLLSEISARRPLLVGATPLSCNETTTSTSPTLGNTSILGWHGTVGYFSSDWPVAYLVAAVICGVGILIGALMHVSQPVQQVATQQPPVKGNMLSPDRQMLFVGRITGMVDCRWADPQTETINGASVSLGRRYVLASGLMEITYDTGAKVLLQGPVTYKAESRNSGFMSVGKLTGMVDVEAAKGFTVRTPTATVTDLGTEFGVEVKDDGDTVSHVFQGAVELRQLGDRADASVPLRLTKNQSAEVVRQDGNEVSVHRTTSDPASFVRSEQMAKRLEAQRSSHVHTPRSLWPILDKTLVAWVSLDNLEQQGVGIASIVQMPEFDGIVFGEIAPEKWLASSHMWARSLKDQSANPIETADRSTMLQIAVVYKGTTVILYRNGVEYARYDTGMTQSYSKDAVVLIGKRHPQDGPSQPPTLVGAVEEIRLYNVALRPETIATLRPNEPSSIASVGCWNFEDGTARDVTGTFPTGELRGNARIDKGKLILDGKDSYLFVPSATSGQRHGAAKRG